MYKSPTLTCLFCCVIGHPLSICFFCSSCAFQMDFLAPAVMFQSEENFSPHWPISWGWAAAPATLSNHLMIQPFQSDPWCRVPSSEGLESLAWCNHGIDPTISQAQGGGHRTAKPLRWNCSVFLIFICLQKPYDPSMSPSGTIWH